MTQQQPPYPSSPPYQAPGYAAYGGYGYYPQQADYLAVARKAGILMFVIGGLVLLAGTCNMLSAFVSSPNEVLESQKRMIGESPLDPQTMRVATITFAVLTIADGLAMILLGALVRRGSMAATIASIVLTSLVLLLLALMVLGSIVAATAEPLLGIVACFFAIPAALHGWLLIWLIQSTRGISEQKRVEQQYQQQYWQYQQQYAQGPSGYGAPPTSIQPPSDSSPQS